MRNLLVAMLAVVAVQASPPLLGGYDVVAYFSLPASSNGTMGTAAYTYNLTTEDKTVAPAKPLGSWQFWFANEANLKAFTSDPWKYAPKYGGF